MRIGLSSVYSWPDVRRGGERYVHELGAALARAGHSVRLLSTGARPRRDVVLGVPVTRLRPHRMPGDWPSPWEDLAVEATFGVQALARLGAARLDVWHATSTGDAAAAALVGQVRPGLATVFTDHGLPAAASRSVRPDARAHREVVRHIGAYVCVSEAAAGWLRQDFSREAAVVPPGVRLADWPLGGDRERRPTLLYSGSLTEPRKGLPLLLEAAGLLLAEEPGLQLWLHGQGDPGRVLAEAPEAVRAAVTRCGPLEDAALREAYARAWATVLPSTQESFGMVVVESLACGTPAVVRDDSGGPREIVRSPEVGRLAAGTGAALARAIGDTLELSGRQGTRAACREVAAGYDWDAAVVPALEGLYERA